MSDQERPAVREQLIEQITNAIIEHGQKSTSGAWICIDKLHVGLAVLAALQAHPPAAPTLKLMDSGELHDCTPREFQRWIRKCADAVAIRSDSEAAVIGLAADAIDALLAAPSPAVSVGERAQEQEKPS
jgi:hypothetical protein